MCIISPMNIDNLMKEFSIESNDVRWYLSNNLAYTLLNYSSDRETLTKYIESGNLEVDLYNLEEKYLQELQDLSDRNQLDEVSIRETFNEISILKLKRK